MMLHFVGTAPGEVTIADLARLVNEGDVISVSADDALRSKDLWRAVNQRLLFQLKRGPLLNGTVVVTDQERLAELEREKADLQAQVTGLQGQLQALRTQAEERQAEVRVLERRLAEQTTSAPAADPLMAQMMAKLDELAKRPVTVVAAQGAQAPVTTAEEGVPLFLPTFDKPTEGQVHVKENEAEGSVTSARDKLRELRKR